MISALIVIFFLNSPSAIKQGDEAFIKQEYTAAIAVYESALPSMQNGAELLWRIARCYVSIGDVAKREERERYYRTAESFASRAVKDDSLNSDAHCWRAITVGYVAMYEGIRAKVAAANEIKRELDLALKLNPDNDVAHSVLGTFYRTLGNVGWIEKQLADILLGGLPAGGFIEAERSLKKAIEIAPTIIRHRFELGQLYLDMEKPGEAKTVFTEALKYPPLLASDNRRIERMKKRLQEL